MSHKAKHISRKDFLKTGSAAVGLFPVAALFGNSRNGTSSPAAMGAGPAIGEWQRIRGSWVQTNGAVDGDLPLVINRKGCCIIVDSSEHTAVKQAAAFLAKDIEKITGYLPPIQESPGASVVNIRLVTLGTASLPFPVKADGLKGLWESYHIITSEKDVWLAGSDFRGTCFAAYELAERLGIDPLYLWTGYDPEHKENLIMKRTDFFSGPPAFKFRGFFHDDEDILPRPFEENGYPLRIGDVPLEWYQRFFETALRLRMNMVAPYTRVRRRFEVQKCASDWGLFYTSHHYDILLSNPFGIERFGLAEKRGVGSDWDWVSNKQGMMRYWSGGVEENKSLYTIWPVGLRGTDDHAYTFPEGTSAAEQTRVFNEAILAQIASVKKALPHGRQPFYHFTLYTEMLDKYNNHRDEFELPDDVMIVWPDDNDGHMRALPKDKGKWKHGVYYHLAYFGGNNTKQVAATVSPGKIIKAFREIIHAGADDFMLANVSEMREFVMECRLLSAICTNGNKVVGNNDAVEKYIAWWTNEYFDIDARAGVEKLYNRYFEMLDQPSDIWMGNNLVQEILEELHRKITGKTYKELPADKLNATRKRHASYQEVFALANNVSEKLNRQQSEFLFEQVCLGLLFDARPVEAALMLAEAIKEADADTMWGRINAAYAVMAKLENEISRAERPPFENWYRPTWIKRQESPYNVHRPYDQLRAFIACGGKQSPIVTPLKKGHNIDAAKVWAEFLEKMEKLSNKTL